MVRGELWRSSGYKEKLSEVSFLFLFQLLLSLFVYFVVLVGVLPNFVREGRWCFDAAGSTINPLRADQSRSRHAFRRFFRRCTLRVMSPGARRKLHMMAISMHLER